jgi:hypothetical protein
MKPNDSISFGKHLEKTPDQESPAKPLNKNSVRKDGRLNESMKTEQRKAVKYAKMDLNFVPGP